MKKWIIIVSSVIASVFLGWIISEYIESRYYNSLPSLIVARRETINVRMRLNGIVIWRYKRVFAPASGYVHFSRSYERVRKGEQVAYILTSLGKKVVVRVPYAGLFLPIYDFWNERLSLSKSFKEIVGSLQEMWVNKVSEKIVRLKDGMWIRKGGDVGEILWGYGFYLYISLPRYLFTPEWRKKRYMYVTFLKPFRYRTRGFINYLSLSQNSMNVVLWFFLFDEMENLSRHWIPVEVVVSRKKGVVLPATAVIIENGVKGIMIAKKGRAIFYPVEGEWINSRTFLATNVKDKTLVVSNPVSVREGMWIGY